MANNKDKIRASAQKFLQKGQIDKAIREYQRLVEEDPKDVRTLLKIGDLQTRINANAEATATYGLVAQFYSEQGFFLKAVAVYKQILKLDPNLIDINLKLADLYHQLGLMSDAANQYRSISQLYEQSGRIDDSIKVLQRMVELDPENVASRIKLAELFAKQNMLEDARGEFAKAAQFLKAQHRVDDYVKVAERIIHFDPNDLRTTKELANIYIQKGDPRRALAKLQVCFKANPKDIETLNLLAAAFKDLDQPQKTISVYREIARIHEAAGDTPSFQSVMRRILAIDPDDAEARGALGAGARPPPPIRPGAPGAGPATPPPRRPTMDVAPQQVESAQALAMPTRRITGEMSPEQVAAVQQTIAPARRNTGDISPAQIAAMEAIAAQGAARRGGNEPPTGQNRAVSPAQLAQSSPLPDNALGRIVPAQKAVQAKPETPVQEIDRRPHTSDAENEIEVDTDFGEPEALLTDAVDDVAPPPDGLTDSTRETISRVLVESEVYIKYGLKQKAVDHLRKIFALAPDHREARVRYKGLLVETGATDEAVEVLLGMAAVAVEQGDSKSARDDLEELLGLAPGHRRAKELLGKLSPAASTTQRAAPVRPAAPPPPIEHEVDDDDLTVTDDIVTDDYVPAVAAPRETAARTLSYEPSQQAAEIDLDADEEEVVGAPGEPEIDDSLILGADIEDRNALDDPSMGTDDEPGIIVAADDDDDEVGIMVEVEQDEPDALGNELDAPNELESLTFADSGGEAPAVETPTFAVETAPPGETLERDGLDLDGVPDLDAGPELELEATAELELEPELGDLPGLDDENIEPTLEMELDTEGLDDALPAVSAKAEKPVADDRLPIADEPIVDEPIVDEPIVDEPIAESRPPIIEPPKVEPPKAAPPVAEKPKPVAAKSLLDDDLDALINSAVPSRAKTDPGKAAADKAAAAKAAAEKAAADKAAADKLAADKAAAEKAAAEKAAADKAVADKAAAEKAAADKLAAEKAAAAKAAAERAAAEKAAAAEAAARAEAAKAEAARLDAARVEAAKAREEAARAEAARAEAARAEAAIEAARIEAAKAEAARAAAAAAQAPVGPVGAPAADLSSEIAEVGFYVEQGLEDEARDMVANLLRDHPNHPDLLGLQSKLDGNAAPALPQAPPLEYEPEPEMLIGGDLGLDIAADLQSAAADDDLQESLDDVFDAFKKGVADTVEEADYATHYDLGIAYKEMDLLSDAIREFELAAKDPTRVIGALTMMGLCSLQLGDTEHALEYFQRGLNAAQVTPQEAMALRYEIGVAYEGAGRFGDATKFYEKVHAWDASFRDVEERLARAKDESAGDVSDELDELLTETEAEKASRSKISYV